MRFRACVFVILTCLATLAAPAALRPQTIRTDLNLVIAIDCSYSVNRNEFLLQVNGIANAFLSREIQDAIKSGPRGRIAVSIIQWSGPENQKIVIPWTMIENGDQAEILARDVSRSPRLTAEGVTAIGSAIDFSMKLHEAALFWAERRVIDMQADGTSTWSRGVPIQLARNNAVDRGIVVNGLPILNEVPYLHHYFTNHVIGGPGSFIEIAENYSSFEQAIKRKLLREIRGVSLS